MPTPDEMPIADEPQAKPKKARVPVSRTEGWIAIGLLAVIFVAQVFGLTSTKASVTKWEYRIEVPNDASLNASLLQIGNEGWELVTARRATDPGLVRYEMIFKRPKK